MVAIASAEVFSPRMTSTKGIICTGLKKCIPTKFSGRCKLSAKRVIEIVEVFDAIMVFSRTDFSVSASTAALIFGFSVTASITISTSLNSSKLKVGRIRARVSPIFAGVIFLRSTCLVNNLFASDIPSASCGLPMSFMMIGVPLLAAW